MRTDPDRPVHGLIQKALINANRYQIKPASARGYIVWLKTDVGWLSLRHVSTFEAGEAYACERLARLVE